MLKDVNLAIESAKESGLSASSVQGMQKILEETLHLGWAEDDLSAIVEGVKKSKKEN
jgi:3-hydroxyisobutyrate dehydrogenase-like beta-hydroxyacid dehydrogenase